ncbi:hypothetical protein B296_00029249 [Ensete ventricosum]|uniref:Uncharacterized protein n=1 Tax=Ensete ventricosum TaxID=4639 RepID=A0A426Z1Z4_ENSVE|nr:hypothetical protein B296_00029249 [Ensete ventricosum]
MKATTNINIESLLPSGVSYTYSLSHINGELESFRYYVRWMCVDYFDTRHAMVSNSIFLLLSVFIRTASHFIISYAATCVRL